MARAALGMGLRDLAAASDVHHETIQRFEHGEILRSRTVAALRVTLETLGLEFIPDDGDAGPGVRLVKTGKKAPKASTTDSQAGFLTDLMSTERTTDVTQLTRVTAQAAQDGTVNSGTAGVWRVSNADTEYPNKMVARLYTRRGGAIRGGLVADTLTELRLLMPSGLTVRARDQTYLPDVVETWNGTPACR